MAAAVAVLQDREAGLAEMREAERSVQAMGLRIGITGFHQHHAQVLHAMGDTAAALAALDEGLRLGDATGEAYLLSPLRRHRGRLLQEAGDAEGARRERALALQLAQEQGARFHELAVRVDAFDDAPDAHRARIAELLAAYGAERGPLLQRARARIGVG